MNGITNFIVPLTQMSLQVEDSNPYIGLWRSSAMEKVPYTEDFPEALLVTPEFWDGALGQGKATHILTQFKQLDSGKWSITVRDNGIGIRNERRLLGWAASKSKDLLHQNGHGTKKAMTKYARNYDGAVWSIKWRNSGKNLQILSPPFIGRDTKAEEDEYDTVNLMPSGTEFMIEFESSVLGRCENNSEELSHAIRELITTRYSEEILQRVEFTVEVITSLTHTINNSRSEGWHSLQWHLEEWVTTSPEEVVKICEHRETIDGGYWNFILYRIIKSGQQKFELKENNRFPTYGQKSMKSSRIHIALNGRMIEPVPICKIMSDGSVIHNRFNGNIGFVNFIPNTPEEFSKMPSPSTTKVSFYENDEVMRTFFQTVKKVYEEGFIKFEEVAKRKAKEEAEALKHKEELAKVKAKEEADLLKHKEEADVLKENEGEKKCKKKSTKQQNISPNQFPLSPDENTTKLKLPKKFREDVWDKYIGKEIAYHLCLCCKRTKIKATDFHCGHVISEKERPDLAKDIGNIRPVCSGCNLSMATTNMIDYVKTHGYYIG